ncbi:hypothetical protein [Xanthomonas phage BUDD]|nr:hypothetical protein [Xanthomonas phage BUDD]
MIEIFIIFMLVYGTPALIVGITAFFNVRAMIKNKVFIDWDDHRTKPTTRGDVLGRSALCLLLTFLPLFNHFSALFLVMGWLHSAWYKFFGEWSRTPV